MKKILVSLFVVLFSFSIATSAFAANWVEVVRDNDLLISINLDSLKYGNGKIRVWEKWIYRNEKVIKEQQKILKSAKRPSHCMQYNEYDENNETNRILSSTEYAADGTVIWNDNAPAYAGRIVPDSIGEYVFKFLKLIVHSND